MKASGWATARLDRIRVAINTIVSRGRVTKAWTNASSRTTTSTISRVRASAKAMQRMRKASSFCERGRYGVAVGE
jgi:hypothetical protein